MLKRWIRIRKSNEEVLFQQSLTLRLGVSAAFLFVCFLAALGLVKDLDTTGVVLLGPTVAATLWGACRAPIAYSLTVDHDWQGTFRARNVLWTRRISITDVERAEVRIQPSPVMSSPTLLLVTRTGERRRLDISNPRDVEERHGALAAVAEEINQRVRP